MALLFGRDFGVDLPEDVGVTKGFHAKVQYDFSETIWQKIYNTIRKMLLNHHFLSLAKKLPKTGKSRLPT